MADLYVLYLRAYTETLRGAPLSIYQPSNGEPATNETPETAIAMALGVEDATLFKAQASEVESDDETDPDNGRGVGYRRRWSLMQTIERDNAAEPPTETEPKSEQADAAE